MISTQYQAFPGETLFIEVSTRARLNAKSRTFPAESPDTLTTPRQLSQLPNPEHLPPVDSRRLSVAGPQLPAVSKKPLSPAQSPTLPECQEANNAAALQPNPGFDAVIDYATFSKLSPYPFYKRRYHLDYFKVWSVGRIFKQVRI